MAEFPLWFNPEEYDDFITESRLLFEFNVPLQKQKVENKKKILNFDRQTAIRRNNLKMELMRDAAQAKAKGIQMGLGEEYKTKLLNNFYDKLLEAANPVKSEKRKMRPEVDPADRERDRKRESRRQEKQTGLKNILIVKNKSLNRTEIIEKSDFDAKNHELIKGRSSKMDKGSVTIEDLKRYSQRSDFRNTKTSIRILGKIQKITEKEQADQAAEQEQTGGGGGGSGNVSMEAPPPPPRPRVPADGKEITDINSTYPDWDHNAVQMMAGIPEILNTLSGVEMSPEMQQALTDSRTLGESLDRFVKELLKTFPNAAQYKYEPADKPVKTGKKWNKFDVTESMPKASLYAKNGKEKLGIAIKIGSQFRPADKGEAGIIFQTVLKSVDPQKTASLLNLLIKDLASELKSTYSKAPNPPSFTHKKEGLAELEKQTWELETANSRQQLFLDRCKEMVEMSLNRNKDLKAAFLTEALTGVNKFDGGDGIANMMFYMNKDGSDTKAIPLNPGYFSVLAKSEDTDLVLKFVQGEIPKNSPALSIIQNMAQLNESVQDGIREFENLAEQMPDPLALMKLFGLQIQDATFKKGINYANYYFEDFDQSNYVTFDPGSATEIQIAIPVQPNFAKDGQDQDVLEKGLDEILESYVLMNDYLVGLIQNQTISIEEATSVLNEEFNLFEKRNYRKEYDNYHGKPEQRANRSKRVLARRKLEKEGRVKKGDGKDVDHKDGNPQNNSDSNLRVLSKSKNRSMNEDHGAGFDATPELLDRYIQDTPGAINPNPNNRKSLKYVENKFVEKKKK